MFSVCAVCAVSYAVLCVVCAFTIVHALHSYKCLFLSISILLRALQVRAYKWSTSHRCFDGTPITATEKYSPTCKRIKNQLRHQRYHNYTRTLFRLALQILLNESIEFHFRPLMYRRVVCVRCMCSCVRLRVPLAFDNNSVENTSLSLRLSRCVWLRVCLVPYAVHLICRCRK